MTQTLEQLYALVYSLKNEEVFDRGIAGNSLCLWIGAEQQEEEAIALWLDAPWRLESASQIVSTSADVPWEPDEGESNETYEARLEEAGEASLALVGRRILSIEIDANTWDLTIGFEGGYRLRTFSVWRDGCWHVSDYRNNVLYQVTLAGVVTEELELPTRH